MKLMKATLRHPRVFPYSGSLTRFSGICLRIPAYIHDSSNSLLSLRWNVYVYVTLVNVSGNSDSSESLTDSYEWFHDRQEFYPINRTRLITPMPFEGNGVYLFLLGSLA